MDGVVHDDQVEYAVEHAQRVAEGVNHEIHRNTWRYSVVIEQQRVLLAERRERLLTSEIAAIMLLERSPEKAKETDEDVLSDAGRAIALYHLDRLWAEHLAELSEVREGVHLRALGSMEVPIDRLGLVVPFVDGETIHTEISRKFTRESVASLYARAGLEMTGWHVPPNEWFAISVARRARRA